MSWLDEISVASPCQESWEEMPGDARSRSCERCEQRVYDLSELSREEGLRLIGLASAGERVCARFRRRADGRVLTVDCPERLMKVRSASLLRQVAAALLALVGVGVGSGCESREPVMGEVCPPPPSPTEPAPVESRGRALPRAPEAG